MTEYFEVRAHEDTARLGTLRLTEPLSTPGLIGERLQDAGSLWSTPRTVPPGDESVITLLPHRSYPPGTPPTRQTSREPEHAVEGPAAAVVTTTTAADTDADVYVLSTAAAAVGDAESFLETITAVRRAIPTDTALYLPGVATPQNVALLVYAGVDLVDRDRAIVAGTQGRYLTTTGAVPLTALTELPCPCSACDTTPAAFDETACIEHNQAQLRTAIATVRGQLRSGHLRTFLEGHVHHQPWQAATLRALDDEGNYLDRHAAVVRSTSHVASPLAFDRPAVRRYARRVQNRFEPRLDAVPLVLFSGPAHTPAGATGRHEQLRGVVDNRGHLVSLTAPLGVVPDELDLTYPAQHYEPPQVETIGSSTKAVLTDRLEAYLTGTDYPRVIAHVSPAYKPIVDAAVDRPTEYTVTGHPTNERSLQALADTLAETPTYTSTAHRNAIVRGIADYMFGHGAGDALFEATTVEGQYPRLRVLNRDGVQLAAVVPDYGVLALTLAGARRWQTSSGAPTKTVEIEAFVPEGDVLAPGVVTADNTIRPGEEVLIDGPAAFGVGRATMPGPAMVDSTRGKAVTVRHIDAKS